MRESSGLYQMIVIVLMCCVVNIGVGATAIPTRKPTASPTNHTESPTLSPTSSPTFLPNTTAPTHTPPTTAFYKDYGFYLTYLDNANGCGRNTLYTFLVFGYIMAGAGPVYLALVLGYKKTGQITFAKRMKTKAIQILALFNGWFLWFFNYALISAFDPRGCTGVGFALSIEILSLIISTASFATLIYPMQKETLKYGDKMVAESAAMGMSCNIADCVSVKQFGREVLGIELKVKTKLEGDVYTSSLVIPAIRRPMGLGTSLSEKTFTASNRDKMAAVDSVYTQASQYLGQDSAYAKVREGAIRSAHTLAVVGSTDSDVVQGKSYAPHFLALAVSQGLVETTPRFSETWLFRPTISEGCNFTLVEGVSEIAQAINMDLVRVANPPPSYRSPGDQIFECRNLKAAMPYLLHGYTPVQHRITM